MKVVVVPYDPEWREMFLAESRVLENLLRPNAVNIHHIWSTSISTICAKPIIDMLIEARSLSKVDARNPEMATEGYEAKGEYGIAGRRYFRKDNPAGVRTHQVHVFKSGSADVNRHLAFRDYMLAHHQEALRYSELKVALAKAHPDDIHAYMDGKDSLIKEVERRALSWVTSRV